MGTDLKTRRFILALAVAWVAVAPVRAELRYTLRTEAKPSTVAPTAPPNPLFTMLSSLVLGMIAPPGGMNMNVTVGDGRTRVDYPQAFAMVPAGGAVITSPDGTITVIDPAARTFWKVARPDAAGALAGPSKASLTIERSGTFAMVAGVRAEHATIQVTMPLPTGGTTLPGLPADLRMSGEAWFSDAHRDYARGTGLFSGLAAVGLDGLADAGFLMKSVLRSELFGPQEVESIVTAISEGPVPAGTFEVPAGFTEVPPPGFGAALPSLPR